MQLKTLSLNKLMKQFITKTQRFSTLCEGLCVFVALCSLSFFALSCGMPEDQFRLEVQFKNLNQGDFYLFNYRNGTKDTLHISDGRCTYDVEMHDTTTYVLMFPNFSELPIFAQPGTLVKMTGDVSHLKETEVTGTADNDQMTAFRLATNELMPPELRQKAEEYIREHPSSASSVYLLRRYFIQSVTADYPKALELCSLLLEAQPTSVELVHLHKQLGCLSNMTIGNPLPHFTATDTNGKSVGDSLLRNKANVILAWATWNFESQNAVRQMKMVWEEHPRDLSVITICLDASPSEGRNIFARDSLSWSNICDGQMWDSPLVTKLGITFIPDNILIDKQGNIIARSLKTSELRTKARELLE